MNKTHLSCSIVGVNVEQSKDTEITNILTCVLNSAFCLITCMGNSMILHVIRKTQELHSPSFAFLFCLAASDLFVGLICQPFFVAYKVAELGNDFNVYCTLRMIQSLSSWTTSGVSLLILSGVSIDRLLALTLHLRYNMVVTIPRVIQTAVCLWIFAITVVISRFWMKKWIVIPAGILALTFFVTTASTLKIFQIVRRHRRQISQQQQCVQINTVNVLRCRKSAVTVLYVYGLFLIFYLPFLVTMFVDSFVGYTRTVKIAYDYTSTVVFINSSLNPLVYCWRIKAIRRAVKNTLRKN
ncbi:melanocyte-stimulating hormone receptor-like [Oculina patagonica]